MATVVQYVNQMKARQQDIAFEMGTNLTSADMRLKILNTSILAFTGTLMKVLVDKGVITNAELTNAFAAAAAEGWPELE